MLSASRPARSPTRSSDTNGQSKLRHYEVPGAEVTPRYGATHHFGAAATIHGRETPLERKGPLLRVPGHSRSRGAPEGNLFYQPNSLAINFYENNAEIRESHVEK